jgi:ribosomal protein S18 acetylase RimI-like enzyme
LRIRTFNGTIQDAQGIIDVDQRTFGDCHYTPEYIVRLEADPLQHAWIVEDGGAVLGFASAFATHALAADRWDVDELAVHPEIQGRGWGTALVAQALAEGLRSTDLSVARALVATNNQASRRAFIKNDFHPADKVELMVYEVSGRVPRPVREGAHVRLACARDVDAVARWSGQGRERVESLLSQPGYACLVAERGGEAVGYLEMIGVRTLQYSGFWIESLTTDKGSAVVAALLNAAIETAKADERCDEVGYLVPSRTSALRVAVAREGFRHIGAYESLVRELCPE